MYYLKDKNKKKTPLILKYYINRELKYFTYSVGISIEVDLWDMGRERPVKSRGSKYPHLKPIEIKLNTLQNLFEGFIRNLDINNKDFDPLEVKQYLDSNFKKKPSQSHSPKFLNDFIIIFTKDASNKINRNTKKKYTKTKITQFKKLSRKIREFEEHRNKKILLANVNIELYDELFLYWQDVQKFSVNYIGLMIRELKNILTVAQKDYKYTVSQDYKKKEFASVQEEVVSIALREDEIDLIYNYDFSESPTLNNCRNWAIIGFWTGLRLGDLMRLDIKPGLKYIEVEPQKTSNHDINIVIPLHHQISKTLSKYGMPVRMTDEKFNLSIKMICKMVGLNEIVKGSLVNNDTNRKEVGMYEKYKLVSSHTCRRSFATNMYLMNFPTLSIMKITGHTTEKSFLKYIKVTPKEHAEKLMDHWEEYYKNKKH